MPEQAQITGPAGYAFTDIFNIPELTRLCESFSRVNNTTIALLDLEGNVHIATAWQELCTRFHRVNPQTASRCLESDTALASDLASGLDFNIYHCKNGLVDIAVPVKVRGEHVGNFFTGQFFFDKPLEAFFIQQAEEFGFDRQSYLAALHKVPVKDEQQLKITVDFLVQLAQMVGETGYERLRIIEHDKAEQQRLQDMRDAAERANAEKSLFLAKMSHELRTPMHAILSFTRLGLKKVDDPRLQHYLENIHTSGLRLTGILDTLLDLTKLEAGKMTLSRHSHDVHELVEQAASEVATLLADHPLTIRPSTLDNCAVPVDKKLILQVLINLLSNAIKFSPAGSKIEIAITQNATPEDGMQAFLEVAVIDQGVGIPDSEIGQVFDKYVQSSRTHADSAGTGLGLSISKEIIELHGGKIWAESPPPGRDVGSAFVFSLPLDP